MKLGLIRIHIAVLGKMFLYNVLRASKVKLQNRWVAGGVQAIVRRRITQKYGITTF
jgi:hypothetical protein